MPDVYTVTRSAPTGDELISIWEDESAAIEEAKSLVPFLKTSEEIHVDHWLIGNRVCQHVCVFDDTYEQSEDDDTPLVSEQ
jgi:hypothetical protein